MRIFASDRLSGVMARLGKEEGEAIVSPMVTRAIEKAQRRVEEQNFSSRKNLLEYDDVMNQQRQVVYDRRRESLLTSCDLSFMEPVVEGEVSRIVEALSPQVLNQESWNISDVTQAVEQELGQVVEINELEEQRDLTQEDLIEKISSDIHKTYREKAEKIGAENMRKIESYLYLQIIDQAWKEHLLAMDALKDSVSLRGYGQRDPLQEYKKEAFQLFASMIDKVEGELTLALLRLPTHEEMAMSMQRDAPEDGLTDQELSYHHQELSSDFSTHTADSSGAKSAEEDPFVRAPRQKRVSTADSESVQPYKREAPKVGRNDLCPCGSGKKYKKCHGLSGALGLD